VYNLAQLQRCPYCGSDKIIIDYSRGIIVCKECGSVIEDTLFDYTLSYSDKRFHKKLATKAEKRYTIYEREQINFSFINLKLSRRISNILREDDPKIIASAIDIIKYDIEIIKNECINQLLRKLQGTNKLIALEIAKQLSDGEYPLLSYYAQAYRVAKSRVVQILKKVRKCIEYEQNTYS
jgi:ribosomal protein L37AE/L43A